MWTWRGRAAIAGCVSVFAGVKCLSLDEGPKIRQLNGRGPFRVAVVGAGVLRSGC